MRSCQWLGLQNRFPEWQGYGYKRSATLLPANSTTMGAAEACNESAPRVTITLRVPLQLQVFDVDTPESVQLCLLLEYRYLNSSDTGVHTPVLLVVAVLACIGDC